MQTSVAFACVCVCVCVVDRSRTESETDLCVPVRSSGARRPMFNNRESDSVCCEIVN